MRALVIVLALIVGACSRESSVMDEIARVERRNAETAARNQADAARFMEQQRARTGVETRASGLAYETTRRAPDPALPSPPRDGQVLVEYEGRLADGTVFDSSAAHGGPAQFGVSEVVPGFSEMLQLMRPGQEVIAYMPPELAYGARGSPPAIPPNAALAFRIRLLAFARADGRTVAAPQR
ncbi:MAG: FKBP-type peptidyl-prolyl cis-trans isomerase [Hyphomonadaceae bacterium]|nr:FKBP-type peptidyl-prolyl cis-trans isomerase [Hyphomonadaceae bacterium]